MLITIGQKKYNSFWRAINLIVLIAFVGSLLIPPTPGFTQTIFSLPSPGSMVNLTTAFMPPTLRGITIHPDNPLSFDFLLDTGDNQLTADELKQESTKLIKYFLSSLTIPENDLWVNLSPYEKDRIIPEKFGITEMGRDLLAQDYILKQLTASLIYPEEKLGQEFWDRVYKKAYELYGTTEVPINTFNKVWVVPDKAIVYEQGNTAYVVHSHLKVMLEEDYTGVKENLSNQTLGTNQLLENEVKRVSNASSQVVREVVLPEIEKEVNEGKNFAPLRQVFYSLILATWYKKNLHDTLLSKIYINQGKIDGVDVDDKTIKEKIYQQYLAAFQKGVYNYIREDFDPNTQTTIPRKYFSGGIGLKPILTPEVLEEAERPQDLPPEGKRGLAEALVRAQRGKVSRVEAALAETTGDAKEFLENLKDTAERKKASIGKEERDTESQVPQIGKQQKILWVEIGSELDDLAAQPKPGELKIIKPAWMELQQIAFEIELDPKTREFKVKSRIPIQKIDPFEKKSYLKVGVSGTEESDWHGVGEYMLKAESVDYLTEENKARIVESAVTDEHQDLIRQILALAPAGLPIWKFIKLERDLFGFASRTKKANLIALHESVAEKPVAIFHEVGEYLIQDTPDAAGLEKLKLDLKLGLLGSIVKRTGLIQTFPSAFKGKIIVRTSLGRILGEVALEGEALTMAVKHALNPHYLLRALQRQVFGELDTQLSEEITRQQEAASEYGSNFHNERELYLTVVNKIEPKEREKWRQLIRDYVRDFIRDGSTIHVNRLNVITSILEQFPDNKEEQEKFYQSFRAILEVIRDKSGTPINRNKRGLFDGYKAFSEILEDLDSRLLFILFFGTSNGQSKVIEGYDPITAMRLLYFYFKNYMLRNDKDIQQFGNFVERISSGEFIKERWTALSQLIESAEKGEMDKEFLNLGLLETIASSVGDDGVQGAYRELRRVATYVKTDKVASGIVTAEFLKEYSNEAKGSTSWAYMAIGTLFRAGIDKRYPAEEVRIFLDKLVNKLGDSWIGYQSLDSLVRSILYAKEIDSAVLDLPFLSSLLEFDNPGLVLQAYYHLAKAGVVNKENFEKIKNLFDIINDGIHRFNRSPDQIYQPLKKFIQTVKDKDLNRNVLNMDVLAAVFRNMPGNEDYLEREFTALEHLAETVKAEGLNEVILEPRVLLGSWTGAGTSFAWAAGHLRNLARAVKRGEVDSFVLTSDLLPFMAENLQYDIAYGALLLQAMAEAGFVTSENMKEVKEFITVLGQGIKKFRDDLASSGKLDESGVIPNMLGRLIELFQGYAQKQIDSFAVDFNFLKEFLNPERGRLNDAPANLLALNDFAEVLKRQGIDPKTIQYPIVEGTQLTKWGIQKFILGMGHAKIAPSLDIMSVYLDKGGINAENIKDLLDLGADLGGIVTGSYGLSPEALLEIKYLLKAAGPQVIDIPYLNSLLNTLWHNHYDVKASIPFFTMMGNHGLLRQDNSNGISSWLMGIFHLIKVNSGQQHFSVALEDVLAMLKLMLEHGIVKEDNLKILKEIIKEIPPDNAVHYYKGIEDLVNLGVVKPSDLEELKVLIHNMNKIKELSAPARRADQSYHYVIDLINKVKQENLSPAVLDIKLLNTLLVSLLKNRGDLLINSDLAFSELERLALTIKRERLTPEVFLNRDLLIALVEKANSISVAFHRYQEILIASGHEMSEMILGQILDGINIFYAHGRMSIEEYLNKLPTFRAAWPPSDFIRHSPLYAAVELLENKGSLIEEVEYGTDILLYEMVLRGRVYLLLLPPVLAEQLKGNTAREMLKDINPSNYEEELHLAALFVTLRQDIPLTAGLSYEEFLRIVKGDTTSKYTPIISAYIQKNVFGKVERLNLKQQDQIIALGIALHRAVLGMVKKDGGNENVITFRELIRFNENFSRFYLRDTGLKNVLELFILTATNIYGRVLDTSDKRKEFAKILIKLLEGHRELLGQAQVESEGLRGNLEDVVKNIMLFGDYEHLGRQPQAEEIVPEINIRALVERARQVGSASLLIVDDDNAVVVNSVLTQMSQEEDTVMIRLSMNGFSRRQELFGMYIPKTRLSETEINSQLTAVTEEEVKKALKDILGLKDEEMEAALNEWQKSLILNTNPLLREAVALYLKKGGQWREFMEWQDGLLVKLRDLAKKNPNKKFLLAMENISAAPDGVRLLLNPVLWERMVEIPEKGRRIELPENMNFILTMHKDTVIKDESFMNRPLVQYVPDMTQDDWQKYLTIKTGLPAAEAENLLTIFNQLGTVRFKEAVRFNGHDLLEIAQRIKGVSEEKTVKVPEFLLKEIYDYLLLRLRTPEDREKLTAVVSTFPGFEIQPPVIEVDRERAVVNFDGVQVKVSKAFIDYARRNPQKDFVALMNDRYRYIVTEMEMRLLSQLARATKGYGNKAIQLEGPSGEGKTEIGRVWARLLGFNLRERTINQDTNLSEFRGQIRPTKDGRYELYEPQYLTQIEEARNIFLFNEINTNESGSLYYWLFPEMTGRAEKALGEFAQTSDESIVKTARINQNNLWLFTVNPEANYYGRGMTPPIVSSHVTVFTMAQDLNNLPQVVEGHLRRNGLAKRLKPESLKYVVKRLAALHYHLKQFKAEKRLSSPQDITPRDIISVTDKFKQYLSEKMDPKQALLRAVEEVYVYTWQKGADVQLSRLEVKKFFGRTEQTTALEALTAALKQKERPVMVFGNATNDPQQIREYLKKAEPEAIIKDVPLSYFHRQRHFLGGLMPLAREKKEGLEAKIDALRPPLEEKLGLLPSLIQEARLNPNRTVFVLLYEYSHLNPQVAPLLNEFFQTGRIDGIEEMVTLAISEELINLLAAKGKWQQFREEFPGLLPEEMESLTEEQKLSFARWFYSQAPKNLRFVATSSSVEEIKLSPAEINRFLTVNISEEFNALWLERYLRQHISTKLKPYTALIGKIVRETFDLYVQQARNWEYEHNRLGRRDIAAFWERLDQESRLDEDKIKKLAFYTLAMGLRTKYREEWEEKIDYQEDLAAARDQERISYAQRKDGIYLIVDGLEFKTRLTKIPEEKFLAPTKAYVRQLASILLGLESGRPIITEGYPGGGKTSGIEDAAKRIGLKFYKDLMYEDIDLGEFLGRLSKEGQEFLVTALKHDANGHRVVKFLRAYAEGGIHLLDEGAVGTNSQEVITFLSVLSQLPAIDLGVFHPGLAGEVIKRHRDFHLAIAQNPAHSTAGREKILYSTDTLAHKIWTDNALDQEDALAIINYHLDKPDAVLQSLKEEMATIHREFTDVHPRSDEISPRQLIMIARILNQALEEGQDLDRAAFEGVMAAYLTGVSKQEFEQIWTKVSEITQGRFDRYLEEWKEPIDVKINDGYVQFNGMRLPKSVPKGNIQQNDVFIIEDLPFESRSLRAMALGVLMNMPVALLEEEGADAFDLIKKFAYLTGYELVPLWSHPQMTKMHLLTSLLPKFEALMDRYGIKREEAGQEFLMSLGFIARYLMEEKEYNAFNEEERQAQAQKLLFFHLMDAVPERQRVMLNELLTTSKIQLLNEKGEAVTYVLPEWVHIVVSSSLEHKFSSAFINRFLPIQVNTLENLDELIHVIQNRWPLVREEEVSWLKKVVGLVVRYEKQEAFGLHYGFSPQDIYKLAALIHLEKQRDMENNRFNTNPLYYFLKAITIVYGLGLAEDDAKIFEEKIVQEGLLGPLLNTTDKDKLEDIYARLLAQIKKDLVTLDREVYEIRIDVSQLGEGEGLKVANGMSIKRNGQGYIIETAGANIYQVSDQNLNDWTDLTKGNGELLVKQEGDHLVFQLKLIKSIGGVILPRDEFNRMRSLPENEVPTKEFIRFTPEMRMLGAAVLRGWQPVEDHLGRLRPPRVLLMNGRTGTAKTTFIRNLSRVWGVPLYILNAYEDMKVSDMTVGLKLEEGKFQVGIKEFLARVGKINGQRISVPSKTTSNRNILLIDEANAAPDILYSLAPLLRGEKKFTVEYAGESFEVEVDDEVLIALTFNPAETYAGRGAFDRELIAHAEKLWAPDPLRYPDLTLIDILREYHRRGITKAQQELKEQLPTVGLTMHEAFAKVSPYQETVKNLEHPALEELGKVGEEGPEKTQATEPPAVAPTLEPASVATPQVAEISYDVNIIRKNAQEFTKDQGHLDFARDILAGFLLALGDGEQGLNDVVLKAASILGPDVVEILQDIVSLYGREIVKESELKGKFLKLRRVFMAHDVALFMKRPKKRALIILSTEKVKRRLAMSDENLTRLGEDPAKYADLKSQAAVVGGEEYSRPGVSGFFEGEFAFAFEKAVRQELAAAGVETLKNVTFEEFVEWVAFHELGHVMDNLRLRVRGYKITRLIRWTKLAHDVNASVIGLWLSENLELNSILFPLIFSPKAKEYALYELVNTIRKNKDKKSYYVQAAKGILNGILLKQKGEKEPLITDELEEDRIDAVKKLIEGLTSEELNKIAVELYQQPKEYLATAKAGAYKGKVLISDGGTSLEDINHGVDGTPDVDMEYEDGKAEMKIKTPKGKGPKVIEEPKGGKRKPDAGGKKGPKVKPEDSKKDEKDEEEETPAEETEEKEPDISGVKGDIIKLAQLSPGLISRFLEIFAGVPKIIKVYAESGDEIDIERIITGDLEPFFRQKIIQALASLSSGVTVDISGSTLSRGLHEAFVQMSKYYASLFYYSAVRNKEVEFSISAVGDSFHPLLDFRDSRNKMAVEEGLTKISTTNDYGGINTKEVLEGLKKKYADQKHKKYKMEMVFTDGEETSGLSFEELRQMADSLEKELGIDIVFIGLNTDDVENYSKFINLKNEVSAEQLVDLIIRISLLKVERGMLPHGNLAERFGMEDKAAKEDIGEEEFLRPESGLKKIPSKDSAILTKVSDNDQPTQPPGGIDLNPMHLNLEIKRDSQGVPLPVPLQPIEQMKIEGFVPIIINITPITRLPFFLGAKEENGDPSFDLSQR